MEPETPVPPDTTPAYQGGTTGAGRLRVLHAIKAGMKVTLCGREAVPLAFGEWAVPFSPSVSMACAECSHLALA